MQRRMNTMSNEMDMIKIKEELLSASRLTAEITMLDVELDDIECSERRLGDELSDKLITNLTSHEYTLREKLNKRPSLCNISTVEYQGTRRPACPEKASEKTILFGAISNLLAILSAVIWALLVLFDVQSLGASLFSVFCLLGFGGLGVYTNITLREINEWYEKDIGKWNEEEEKIKKKINEEAERADEYFEEHRELDNIYLSMVEDCDSYYKKKLAAAEKKIADEARELADKKAEIEAKRKALSDELSKIDVISSSLYYDAHRILDMLELGRAETLKEAINMALEERRLEEEEEKRELEALEREQILKEQAEENRRHNEEMQRMAKEEARETREHNRRMEEDAQKRAREAAAKERSDSYAASQKCMNCQNRSKCSYSVKQNSLTCSAYIPK